MRLGCGFLNEPIYLSENYVNVLSIENKALFRRFVKAMMSGEPEEENFIFSKDFKPLSFKKNICFIYDCFNLSFSASFLKKVYEDMEDFCNNEMLDETFELKRIITNFIEKVTEEFDFDFTFKDEVALQDIFKIQNIRPDTESSDMLESLYEFIVLIQKYAPVQCFVILGIHQNFSSAELETFYKELIDRGIRLLDVESTTDFARGSLEKLTIIDEDLCEIVEKES
ncbi:MAG: type II-A CRISPR-associated protein Csn2 [Oscillospiraceae bacterium]|nr:type II-A CRISPR-associated protein Csn2 [Oscillospiraceae bacterium]